MLDQDYTLDFSQCLDQHLVDTRWRSTQRISGPLVRGRMLDGSTSTKDASFEQAPRRRARRRGSIPRAAEQSATLVRTCRLRICGFERTHDKHFRTSLDCIIGNKLSNRFGFDSRRRQAMLAWCNGSTEDILGVVVCLDAQHAIRHAGRWQERMVWVIFPHRECVVLKRKRRAYPAVHAGLPSETATTK